MATTTIWADFLIGLGTNILAAFIGVVAAILVRDRFFYRRRFEGWTVHILYKGKDVLPSGRSIGWETAKEISGSTAEESVLLKGVVSPYARLHCDLITEGRDKAILVEKDVPRKLLGLNFGKTRTYTIDLSRGEELELLAIEPLTLRMLDTTNPGQGEASTSLPSHKSYPPNGTFDDYPVLLLNFAHPLSSAGLAAIEELVGRSIDEIQNEPSQIKIDNNRPLIGQITAIVNELKIPSRQWQNGPIFVILPGYAPAASALVAELHGRMGHFPSIIRMRPVAGTTPPAYEPAEVLNLQTVRDAARERRVKG